MSMLRFTRRGTVMAAAALALAACGSASDSSESTGDSGGTDSTKLVLQDVVIGDPNAPVTLVEYASWTCPACNVFHTRVLPTVKSDYIDTGKVKLVIREYPITVPDVTVAGFALARCAGDDAYHDVLNELFVRQEAILTLARQGGPVVAALKQIGANHGIEGDEAFQACLDDQNNLDAISASVAAGRGDDVDSTPAFFINGELLEGNAWVSPQTFSAELDAALAESASE